MKVIKEFDIETAHMRFSLEISERDDGKGYVGEYVGNDVRHDGIREFPSVCGEEQMNCTVVKIRL